MSSIVLNDGGVPIYPDFASFPSSANDGALAVDASSDTLYEFDGTSWIVIGPGGGGGSGTVTSVGLSAPNIFSVSGSPVTVSGTLSFALVDEVANSVFAGPASGADDTPSFRALVVEDLPSEVSTAFTDKFTLNSTDITNKYVVLSRAPSNPSLTVLDIVDGIVQKYSIDYSISGTTLSWSGTFLDGVLTDGDELIVQLS